MASSVPVTVHVADVQPVAGFIAKVAYAESLMRSMTKEQVYALPVEAVTAMTEIQAALRQLEAGTTDDPPAVARYREETARQILTQKVPCAEHPMPFPKPSCWTCGRNGAFHRAAAIALGEFMEPGTPAMSPAS